MSRQKNNKATSTKEGRMARFKLVWSIVAFLYFISMPKTPMAVILNLIPVAVEVYEEFDDGSLIYKIFAIALVLVFLIPVAAVFKLIPEYDWFKYIVIVVVIKEILSRVNNKK